MREKVFMKERFRNLKLGDLCTVLIKSKKRLSVVKGIVNCKLLIETTYADCVQKGETWNVEVVKIAKSRKVAFVKPLDRINISSSVATQISKDNGSIFGEKEIQLKFFKRIGNVIFFKSNRRFFQVALKNGQIPLLGDRWLIDIFGISNNGNYEGRLVCRITAQKGNL